MIRTSSFAPNPRLGALSAITPMISRVKRQILDPILVIRIPSYLHKNKQMALEKLGDKTDMYNMLGKCIWELGTEVREAWYAYENSHVHDLHF